MQGRIKKSTILAIILITLLLHLLFLYFFTTVPFSYSNNSISQLIDTILGKEPELNAKPQLQSHAPQQSAPVIFRDEPEEKEPVKQQPPPEPEQKKLVSHAVNPLNKPVEEKKEQIKPVEKEKKQEKEINEITKNVPQSTRDERREEKTTHPDEKPKNKKQKLESTMLAELEREKTFEKHQIIREKKPLSVRPESIEGPPGNSSKKNNQKKSPQMNLADLSQQFMQKMATVETGASGALRVQGNSAYGHPSAYQIALERYVAKMCQEIETAYRIGTNQSIQETAHKPFHLVVEVNSDGRINTIYPSQSSGIARIDEFAISIFRSASRSFPKLPEAIGSNFRIQFGIHHIDNLGELRQGVLSNG